MKDMFSRMETLLQGFGLEEREQQWTGIKELPTISEEKWEQVRRKLEQERSRTERILSNLLQRKTKD